MRAFGGRRRAVPARQHAAPALRSHSGTRQQQVDSERECPAQPRARCPTRTVDGAVVEQHKVVGILCAHHVHTVVLAVAQDQVAPQQPLLLLRLLDRLQAAAAGRRHTAAVGRLGRWAGGGGGRSEHRHTVQRGCSGPHASPHHAREVRRVAVEDGEREAVGRLRPGRRRLDCAPRRGHGGV